MSSIYSHGTIAACFAQTTAQRLVFSKVKFMSSIYNHGAIAACFALTTAQRLVCWQGRVGSQSDLPCLNGAPNPTRPQVLVFFYWLVCIREAGCSRTKLTTLKGSMVSNGRYIAIERVGKYCAQSSPTSALNGKGPRPTALFPLHKAQAGQVALAPNPALPTDQPLRGSWCNAYVCFTPLSHR